MADTSVFFTHLISQIYDNNSADLIVVGGDFNARIGNSQDFINHIDSIPLRNALENEVNSYCDTFLDFLKDVKFCVCSGRVTPNRDDFTFMSSRGKSVVDYVVIPHSCLDICKSCCVLAVTDVIDKFRCEKLLSSTSKAPDHSIVVSKFIFPANVLKVPLAGEKQINLSVNTKRVYDFSDVKSSFMNNSE